MFLIGLVSGVLSSLFAAIVLLAFTDGIRGLRLRRRFSKLKGRYVQCGVDGEPFANRFTEVTQVRRNLLIVEGNDSTPDKWRSTILMDERFQDSALVNINMTIDRIAGVTRSKLHTMARLFSSRRKILVTAKMLPLLICGNERENLHHSCTVATPNKSLDASGGSSEISNSEIRISKSFCAARQL